MAKKSFLAALLVVLAVLGAEAQTNKVYKTDTVIDGKGNKTITVYMQKNVVKGNGNIITRDIDVAAFKDFSMILPATVNYSVADSYACRVTLDENLFEWIDIYQKDDCLKVEMVKAFQQADVRPTKFLIELTAPTLEEISVLGSGDFNFVTPFEAKELNIKLTGSGDVMIKDGKVKKANLSVAGSGSIEARCQMESMDYSVAGTGSIAYPGDVKAVGTVVGGKINKIWGTENNKKKSCDEKP